MAPAACSPHPHAEEGPSAQPGGSSQSLRPPRPASPPAWTLSPPVTPPQLGTSLPGALVLVPKDIVPCGPCELFLPAAGLPPGPHHPPAPAPITGPHVTRCGHGQTGLRTFEQMERASGTRASAPGCWARGCSGHPQLPVLFPEKTERHLVATQPSSVISLCLPGCSKQKSWGGKTSSDCTATGSWCSWWTWTRR